MKIRNKALRGGCRWQRQRVQETAAAQTAADEDMGDRREQASSVCVGGWRILT